MRRLFDGFRAGGVGQLGRDTDADWQKIGADEPYFGVITDPGFRRANLDEAARARFFQTGIEDITTHLQRLNSRFGDFKPSSALDFGCGVGRLTRALAGVTGDAVGVDISDGMLREARKLTEPGIQFQTAMPDRLFDWLVSIIVFQHIPPARGYGLLRQLLARLSPNGCVTLQFAVYREARHHGTAGARIDVETGKSLARSSVLRKLPPGEMVMFDYDLSTIAAILFSAGLEDLSIIHTDHGGFHGAVIYGRKTDDQSARL